MALTYEQEVNLEKLKHEQKKELLALNEDYAEVEHKRKLERLALHLEIAKAGGTQAE